MITYIQRMGIHVCSARKAVDKPGMAYDYPPLFFLIEE